jgi:hypothetical protein
VTADVAVERSVRRGSAEVDDEPTRTGDAVSVVRLIYVV